MSEMSFPYKLNNDYYLTKEFCKNTSNYLGNISLNSIQHFFENF